MYSNFEPDLDTSSKYKEGEAAGDLAEKQWRRIGDAEQCGNGFVEPYEFTFLRDSKEEERRKHWWLAILNEPYAGVKIEN